jgi:hypothetical protein
MSRQTNCNCRLALDFADSSDLRVNCADAMFVFAGSSVSRVNIKEVRSYFVVVLLKSLSIVDCHLEKSPLIYLENCADLNNICRTFLKEISARSACVCHETPNFYCQKVKNG